MPGIGLTISSLGKDCCLIIDGVENKDRGACARGAAAGVISFEVSKLRVKRSLGP